jgi:hypothetical protein
MKIRTLTEQEETLTKFLLSKVNSDHKIPKTVEELEDGKMGTVRFMETNSTEDRKYQKDLIQVQYKDLDNVTILITLTQDNNGGLFELEFWKTDFNPLIRFPTPTSIIL